MHRAYSVLTVKAVDEDARVLIGTATTPNVDRVGDIIDPLGVKFTNPLAFLWQHNADQPIGTVKFDKPTKNGITFEAKIASIDEPGTLKDRLDEAWQSIKMGLVRAVSIGFRPLEYSFMENGGVRFVETEVYELSAVTIPANADCTISTIKSFDKGAPAATGQIERPSKAKSTPGASGSKPNPIPKKGRPIMAKTTTIAEQISAYEATRMAKAARMDELMNEASEKGLTLDAEQTEEYDNLDGEVKAIDAHLVRLRDAEKRSAATAKAVTEVRTVADGSAARAGVVVKAPAVEPGIRFARFAKCIGLGKLTGMSPVMIAEQRYKDDPAIANVIKATVLGGAEVSGNWASALVGSDTSVFADFAEWLRPMTILGKFGTGNIPSLRKVPFRVRLVSQTGGGAGYWVGEGKAKPLTAFNFAGTTLAPLKVANIAVVTMEVVRDSSPSAETILRDQLAAALRERLDIDFISPAKAASAGVSPASITHGLTAVHSSGNDSAAVRDDIRALFGTFIAANNAPTAGVWIMAATTALALSLMQNPLGQPTFPGITMNGGMLFGLPVIVSEYVPSVSAGGYVALVNASDIYLGDDGDVTVDMSTEASLEMSDAPTGSSVTPTAASLVSLFQTNSVGFRAERTINWAPRRTSAVALLDEVNWGLPSASS